MLYPRLTIIPGLDLYDIEQELIFHNVEYKKSTDEVAERTKLFFDEYAWPTRLDNGFYINDIRKGLSLPFFNSKDVDLDWNCNIPDEWHNTTDWNLDMEKDITLWCSRDPNISLTKLEKQEITNVINNFIHWDVDTLEIYLHTLMTTFQHPEIHTMLMAITVRKHAHVHMWINMKKNFKLLDLVHTPFSSKKHPANTFREMIIAMTNVITTENTLKPTTSECFKNLAKNNKLEKFIKLVKRRDQESQEHGNMLKILLNQVEKLHPCLTESIEYLTVHAQFCATRTNKNLTKSNQV